MQEVHAPIQSLESIGTTYCILLSKNKRGRTGTANRPARTRHIIILSQVQLYYSLVIGFDNDDIEPTGYHLVPVDVHRGGGALPADCGSKCEHDLPTKLVVIIITRITSCITIILYSAPFVHYTAVPFFSGAAAAVSLSADPIIMILKVLCYYYCCSGDTQSRMSCKIIIPIPTCGIGTHCRIDACIYLLVCELVFSHPLTAGGVTLPSTGYILYTHCIYIVTAYLGSIYTRLLITIYI